MTQTVYTKVFLTWSGGRSRAMAAALREWLPNVIQALDPWMSEDDIAKGAGWNAEISKNLGAAKIGIVCLTPENVDAPWVNFEAGALSKLPESYVCTYLLGLTPADVKGPLTQFQATKSEDKADNKKLIHGINDKLGDQSLKAPQFESAFEKWWPDLDKVLRAIPATAEDRRPKRTTEDLLEEIIGLCREQDKKSDNILKHMVEDRQVPGPQAMKDYFSSISDVTSVPASTRNARADLMNSLYSTGFNPFGPPGAPAVSKKDKDKDGGKK